MRNGNFYVSAVVTAAVLSGLWVCPVRAQEQASPYADYTVLVETFMVELTAAAVREAGADLIDRDPAGISIGKLLWALRDEDKGRVLSGLKINAGHNQPNIAARETTKKTIPVTRSGPSEHVHFSKHTLTRHLSIKRFKIINADSVRLGYNYSEDTLALSSIDGAAPTRTTTSFDGNVTAAPGKPVIAGATQTEDGMRLLVFVVTLMAPNDSAQH